MSTQRNSEVATEFLAMATSGNVREAYERHVAESFTHHNAYVPGDGESLLLAMEQNAGNEPDRTFVVKQVVDAGDRVVVLSHVKRVRADQEYAVVHIIRFDGSKIVEMWDVAQEIPKDSPNALGVF